jgi:hypothetical protein
LPFGRSAPRHDAAKLDNGAAASAFDDTAVMPPWFILQPALGFGFIAAHLKSDTQRWHGSGRRERTAQ